MSAVPCIDPREVLFSFPSSSVGMRRGRSASGLAPLERGPRRKVSRKDAKTQRRKINGFKTTRAMRPWRSFFASLRLCVRLFFSRFLVPTLPSGNAARALRVRSRQWTRSARACSHAGAWEPEGYRPAAEASRGASRRRSVPACSQVGASDPDRISHRDTETQRFSLSSPCLCVSVRESSSRSHAEAGECRPDAEASRGANRTCGLKCMSLNLNPEKALIFRIIHAQNVPWVMDHGLHCRNSPIQDSNFRAIGNPDLIDKRHGRVVPVPPGGTLSDYVPFYFTPFSPMMLNLKTGYGGITQCPNEDIVVLVSSLKRLTHLRQRFVFTDRHAYTQAAQYFCDPVQLTNIDWAILQNRDFKRDPDDPGKVERYQAEALVHRQVPFAALLAIGCYTYGVKLVLEEQAMSRGIEIKVLCKPGWYF